jgi:hypothetical protein
MFNYPEQISDCKSVPFDRENAIVFLNSYLKKPCFTPDTVHSYTDRYVGYGNQYFMIGIKKCSGDFDTLMFLATFYDDSDIIVESLTKFIKDYLLHKQIQFIIENKTKQDEILAKCKMKCVCNVEKYGDTELVKVYA